MRLLHTETDRQVRRFALGSVIFYCQQKSIEAACTELRYQLVWGGRQTIDDIAADPTVGLEAWNGKVAAPFWAVAHETATTSDGKRALLLVWLRAKGQP